MSKYTTEVRYICEQAVGLTDGGGYSSIDKIIWGADNGDGNVVGAVDKIFDFDFPLTDVMYKRILCGKILKHYYTREIGFETVGLWKHFLCTRMNEIMPYYDKLYESERIQFNPLDQVDITTKHIRDNVGVNDSVRSGNDSGSSNTVSSGKDSGENVTRDMYSDTPQGALDNIENETYLTNARKNTSDFTVNKNDTANNNYSSNRNENNVTNITSTEEYVQQITGKNGSVSSSKLLKEFRDTFINIDMMVIEELSDLFLNLW